MGGQAPGERFHVKPEDLARLKAAMRDNTPFYARKCVKIADRQTGATVPLEGTIVQLTLDAKLEEQRTAGMPMRAIVLKARKEGVSTWVEAKMLQRTTQRENHRAVVLAHDKSTAGDLAEMAGMMYDHLPTNYPFVLKPAQRWRQRSKMLAFQPPLRSQLSVDTAREFEAGRGLTIRDLHGSEVAFWPAIQQKLTALQNAIPDDPDTMIVLESTANGHNYFRELWIQAVQRNNDYVPVFFAWYDDPGYTRPFATFEEQARFEDELGTGPYGDEEPELFELLSGREGDQAALERLNWRRWAIKNRTQGQLSLFHQEYPSYPEQAFLSTGSRPFPAEKVQILLERALDVTDPPMPTPEVPGPELGLIVPTSTVVSKNRYGEVKVPRMPAWKVGGEIPPDYGAERMRVWEHPDAGEATADGTKWARPPGAYVLAVDAASGEIRANDKTDYHAIQVVDHRTRAQVLEYRSRLDIDLLAVLVYLTAVRYNNAFVVPEVTGSYGLPVAKRLVETYKYFHVQRESRQTRPNAPIEDRLGWQTNKETKPLLEAEAIELVRDSSDGSPIVRSRLLAGEMQTYVRNERGKTGAEAGAFDDLLVCWMIAQFAAHQRPLPRPPKPPALKARRAPKYRPRSPVTGY